MAEQELTCICRILRYAPNILRDEHVNIGVLLYDVAGGRTEMRLLESESEFARLRRVHPSADLNLVRGLEGELRSQMTLSAGSTAAWIEKLDATLSNEPVKRELIDHVKSVKVRFMDNQKQWQEQWPPLNATPQTITRLRPLAVEITLDLEDLGEVIRVIEVGG